MQALDKPNGLRARVEFRFDIKKPGNPWLAMRISLQICRDLYVPGNNSRIYATDQCCLIILGTCVAASVSLAFHPATAFQPLHPMTTSKHSEKTIVAQLNSEPSLLASTSDCQSQITQAKQVNAYIREVERAVSFMAEKVL